MEFKLKSISPEGVDAALSKAELYRLLNEPEEAEKIRPTGNDEAILRWNRCVRLIHAHAESDWHREVEIEMGDSTS